MGLIADFVKENCRIYVYGNGRLAKSLIEATIRSSQTIDGIIVTQITGKDKSHDGIEIMDVGDFFKSSQIDARNTGIIVAVSNKNRCDVVEELESNAFHNFICIDQNSVAEYIRESDDVKSRSLLQGIEPVSRVFGLDRGTPIDRYYIENYLEEASREIKKDEATLDSVIEVGTDSYSKKYFGSTHDKEIHFDILDYSNGMDLTNTDTLPKEKYDVFICTQTFNFIYDVKKAIEGAHYMLKPGGYLLGTVAGTITPISRFDMDRWGHYWGFTELSFKKILEEEFDSKDIKVSSFGNALSATAFVQGVSVEDLDDKKLLDVQDKDYPIVIGVTARKEF